MAAMAVLLGLAGVGLSASAITPSAPVRSFHLNRVGGGIFLDGHVRNQKQDSQGFQTKESETFLEEGVEVNTTGYVYHPNFCDLTAGLRLGATQEKIKVNDEEFGTMGTLLGYNLSALLLKEKTFSFGPGHAQRTKTTYRKFVNRLLYGRLYLPGVG